MSARYLSSLINIYIHLQPARYLFFNCPLAFLPHPSGYKRPVSGKTKLPDELKEFMDSTTFEYDPAYINIRDTRVFLTSPYMAEERGLRIIRNGLEEIF